MLREHAGVTTDMIIRTTENKIALITRKNSPFQGAWAIPGGFLDVGKETVEECAVREAKEETSLKVEIEILLGVWSDPKRDPRGHTVSCVYISKPISPEEAGKGKAADDAKSIAWFTKEEIDNLEIAFDHKEIMDSAFEYILSK